MTMEINGNYNHYRPDYPKQEEADGEKISSDKSDKTPEKCTGNTDKVDREIKQLKEEKRKLEQELRTTLDTQKARELTRKLAKVEQELQQKDNDSYRRQNTVSLGL